MFNRYTFSDISDFLVTLRCCSNISTLYAPFAASKPGNQFQFPLASRINPQDSSMKTAHAKLAKIKPVKTILDCNQKPAVGR